ncbi:MAG: NAD(+) synthase [Chitinispirillaceae bacterium]|nr:NAD(+) synthase [Chitinispirillaceae bacterium]
MLHKWMTIDLEKETERICSKLKEYLVSFKRRGYVLGVSGGIDSSVTLGLCARALGPEKVIALQMPERHSADETLALSALVADAFNVRKEHEDISGILEAIGFYRRYDNAVKVVIPEYDPGWKSKIVLHTGLQGSFVSVFHIVAQSPDGKKVDKRLPLNSYLEIVASTNFKQRTRKMLEYYYADRFNYAVAGTPNRLEYDQGFFVKLGDGAADIKPIAHLYKTQVYELAEYLGVPEDIRKRPPTTDTYSLPQGQDEFYFALPYDKMDLCLYGKNTGKSPGEVAKEIGLAPEQVALVYKDIDTKRSTTRYLHEPPVLIEKK